MTLPTPGDDTAPASLASMYREAVGYEGLEIIAVGHDRLGTRVGLGPTAHGYLTLLRRRVEPHDPAHRA